MKADEIKKWLEKPTRAPGVPGDWCTCTAYEPVPGSACTCGHSASEHQGNGACQHVMNATTRGQLLASLVDSSIAYGEGKANPWHADFAWVVAIKQELAELDPRILKSTSGVTVRSAIQVILASTLCPDKSVPTR